MSLWLGVITLMLWFFQPPSCSGWWTVTGPSWRNRRKPVCKAGLRDVLQARLTSPPSVPLWWDLGSTQSPHWSSQNVLSWLSLLMMWTQLRWISVLFWFCLPFLPLSSALFAAFFPQIKFALWAWKFGNNSMIVMGGGEYTDLPLIPI